MTNAAPELLSSKKRASLLNKNQLKKYLQPSIFLRLSIGLFSLASAIFLIVYRFSHFDAHTASPFFVPTTTFLLFCLIFAIVSFITGFIIFFYEVYTTKNLPIPEPTKSLINLKILALYSFVVVNTALSLVPTTIYYPLTMGNLGLSPFAFPSRDVLQEIYVEPLTRLVILSSVGAVICTIILLVLSIPFLIKQQIGTNQGITSRIFWLEVLFRVIIILFLVFESIIHLWGYIDPVSYNQVKMHVFDVDLLIFGPIALILLIFILTGQFHDSSFIDNNLSHWKFRLLLSVASTSLFIVLPIGL